MKKAHTTETPPRFAVLAADVAILTINEGALMVRLMEVNRPPYFSNIAGLPGGLVHPDETAEETAKRIVRDRAHISGKQVHVEQLATFSRIDRDPRGRVVSVGYIALVPWESLSITEQATKGDIRWSPVRHVPHLAYDHDEMLKLAVKRLRSRVAYTTIISRLMPKEFTLTELERSFEVILGKDIDKRNFRKKLEKLRLLKKLDKQKREGAHRPAALYTFRAESIIETEVL